MFKYRNTVFYDFKSRFLVVFSSNYQHRLVLKIPFHDHIFPKISKYHTKNLHFPSTSKYCTTLIQEEFRIFISRLFDSIITSGKKESLKKLCLILKLGILLLWESLVRFIYRLPLVTGSNPQATSSNPRVTSLHLRVTSSNLRVTCSNPQVTSSNSRVTGPNPQVTSSNARVTIYIYELRVQIHELRV